MNKAALIVIIICLGIPFIISFKSKRSRRFRRWAIAVGFCVMFVAVCRISSSMDIADAMKENIYTGHPGSAQEGTVERQPAVLYAFSDIDLSGYSEVGYAEAMATNHLSTSKVSYPIQNALDGNTNTCWQDGVEGNGEGTEITVTLWEESHLQYIVIYNGQVKTEEKFRNNGRVCQLEIRNGQFTEVIEMPDENVPVVIGLMEGWENVSQVTFKINSVYPGDVYADTCISEIVFYR